MAKMTIEKATSGDQILFDTMYKACGVIVSDANAVTEAGRKVVKAGTPLTGDLKNRKTAFTKAGDDDAVGVLLHDVDVTNGSNNGSLVYFGSINIDRLDSATAALITSGVEETLQGCVFFLKDN